MNTLIIIILFFSSPVTQQKMLSAENGFIGTWHGTSICVDRKTDSACKDEEVVYIVKGIRTARDTVEVEAFKIINGDRLSMGILNAAYSQVSHVWTFELNTRVHALWTYQVKDSMVTGTLVELPSKRLIRKVQLRLINE